MPYQPLAWFVALLIFLGGLALLIVTRPLIDSLIIAVLLAYLLDPLIVQCQRRFKLNRVMAVTLVYVLSLILIVGTLFFLGATIWRQWPQINGELQGALAEMSRWLERPLDFIWHSVSSAGFVRKYSKLGRRCSHHHACQLYKCAGNHFQ